MQQIRISSAALAVLLFITTIAVNAVPAPAASAPSAVAGPDWEIDFTPGPLRLYVDPTDGRYYWYFIYTVTNLGERDLVFAPRIELFLDSGEILRSGRGVPTRVVGQIQKLLGDKLLEDQNRIIGDLRVGRENARTGIAMWPAEDQDVTELTLFFGGLSSDQKLVPHPETGKSVRLYRTLRREYVVPGDPVTRGSTPLALHPRANRRGPECEFEFQIRGKPAGCWIYR
ncbi:MAG: hypothetical protein GY895_14520 [Phycisphaera sp.]|nr:hypothetical protein [Phycisphaera sp.]